MTGGGDAPQNDRGMPPGRNTRPARRIFERGTSQFLPLHEADAGATLVNAFYLSADRRAEHRRAGGGVFQGAASPLNGFSARFWPLKSGPQRSVPPAAAGGISTSAFLPKLPPGGSHFPAKMPLDGGASGDYNHYLKAGAARHFNG